MISTASLLVIKTVHSFTNDQNLIDNFIQASEEAAALPEYGLNINRRSKSSRKSTARTRRQANWQRDQSSDSKRFYGCGNLNLGADTNKDELNAYLREMALKSELSAQIDYTESTEVVSTDLVGSRFAGVVDGAATIAQSGRCVLYIWCDNELGYSCQVVHCMEQMMGVRYKTYPCV